MKQYITLEQLNELSDKGKERLQEYFYERYPMGTDRECEEINDIDDGYLPLLSIGQMIEFLGENNALEGEDITAQLLLPIDWRDYHKLCDALWEAVKEVLHAEDK